jgi:hypothetical protein
MMAAVTYPLIFGVSIYAAVTLLPFAPAWVVVLWLCMTSITVVSLALTACSNPGLVRRQTEETPETVSRDKNGEETPDTVLVVVVIFETEVVIDIACLLSPGITTTTTHKRRQQQKQL